MTAGPGVSDKEIRIGFAYFDNGEAANSAVGVSGVSAGDARANVDALIADINAHGGVAGRKLVPVYHRVDALTTKTSQQIEAEVCAHWTQDDHVFVGFVGVSGVLSCLNKAKAVAILDSVGASDRDLFASYPYYAEVSSFNLDRLVASQVRSLIAQRYFSPWDAMNGRAGAGQTKVGIIAYDAPEFRKPVQRTLLPALAQAGHQPASSNVVFVHAPQSNSEQSQRAADVANAVLKFRGDGVDHVLVLDVSGLLTLLFTRQAGSQGYYPRLGVNSQNGAGLGLDTKNYTADSFRGAMGMGWLPTLDIPNADNPHGGRYSNGARRRCLALMKQHGQSYPDANSAGVALLTCNMFYFFKASVEKGVAVTRGPISRDTWLAGLNAMGGTFESTMTFGTSLHPRKHDGAAYYRHVAYVADCTCMRYTSGNVAAP